MNPKTVRLYLNDDCTKWWDIPFSTSNHGIPGLCLKKENIKTNSKARPWECVMSKDIMRAAEETPKLFNHPVEYVYVYRSVVYIVDKFKVDKLTNKKVPTHAVRYRFQQGAVARLFDKEFAKNRKSGDDEQVAAQKACETVRNYVGDEPINYSLGISKVRGDGTPPGPGRGNINSKRGTKRNKVPKGALLRAQNAGWMTA